MPSPLISEQQILNSVLSASNTALQIANTDASTMRVSALGVNIADVSNSDAADFRVSSFSPDASTFRVSALGVNISDVSNNDAGDFLVSAKSGDASQLRISSIVDNGSVSAKSGDGSQLRVSAIQDGAAALNISAKSNDAGLFLVSAKQGDAALFRVSGFTATATNFPVSAVQADAGLLRVSAMLFGNTTGGASVGRSLNVSTSFNVKATAGAVMGWHAWNADTKPNYIRLMNTSGAINVGTDVPIITIALTASSRSDFQIPMGLKGFTAGIGCYATSVVLDDSTTGGTASATGIDIYYI